MNSRVKVPSLGQTSVEIIGGVGGGPAADSWLFSWPVVGGRRVLLVEHFLIKSAFRVSPPSILLASVLSNASWSVSMTWKVRLHVELPLLALRVT